MRTSLASLTVLALGSLLLGACSGSIEIGGRVLDVDEAETEIADQLEATVGQRPASVDCPDEEIPVEEGGTFRCTLTAEDGTTIGLTAAFTNDDGGLDIQVDG